MRLFTLAALFFSMNCFAYDALVWGGPGACADGCVDAAVHVTKLAGLDPMIVTPENFDPSLFENARVWVQPGGKSSVASKAMGKKIREEIKNFIRNGGGYVGFCAGAFLTTRMVGATSTEGLGIIPGSTRIYKAKSSVESITTLQGTRFHYWEGGPYFRFSQAEATKVVVTSRYTLTQAVNGVEAIYGKGKVSVTGTHPEAPDWWYTRTDPDGNDNDEAAAMIRSVLK